MNKNVFEQFFLLHNINIFWFSSNHIKVLPFLFLGAQTSIHDSQLIMQNNTFYNFNGHL